MDKVKRYEPYYDPLEERAFHESYQRKSLLLVFLKTHIVLVALLILILVIIIDKLWEYYIG